MSRRFWVGLMLVALALGAGSAYLIFGRLATRPAPPQPAPLKKIPAPNPQPSVAVSTTAVSLSSEPAKAVPAAAESKTDAAGWTDGRASAATNAKPVTKAAAKPRRNILFKLSRPTAKEVSIVGDFNGWTPHAMKKSGKVWQTSVSLPAGKFDYAFIVDGKRMRDPNNRQTNASGKSSVVTVKPLAARP